MEDLENPLEKFEEVTIKNIDNNNGSIWVAKVPVANMSFERRELELLSPDICVNGRSKSYKRVENFSPVYGEVRIHPFMANIMYWSLFKNFEIVCIVLYLIDRSVSFEAWLSNLENSSV